jgi:DMSO/TMAO reductase YedYZ molybdopterin-dependent catalytic subunit
MNTSRRGFLLGFLALVLPGCNLTPDSGGWKFVAWAEGLTRRVQTLGSFKHALVQEYPASAITSEFPIRSLNLEMNYLDTLPAWKLVVDGLVERPKTYSLQELRRAFPKTSQITRHDCVEGWSAIAQFAGVRLSALAEAVKPHPSVRYVVCYSADADDEGVHFYGSLDLESALHPQILLAYEMNGKPLVVDHGAPLRLKVPNQLGYKSTKYIHRIEFVSSLAPMGQGKGGYWEDQGYEHYAGI